MTLAAQDKEWLDQRFEDVRLAVLGLKDEAAAVRSGKIPCKPAVDIARMNGKVRTLRLLWIPLALAVLGGICSIAIAVMR